MIQGFVESAIQDYEACIIQQQKEAAEAAQREEERQRLLEEEEVRRKKEEEERKVKVVEEERMKREKEESEAREQIRLLEKVKEIVEQDPTFLVSSSLQVSTPCTTYLAIDRGKCERCMSCNLVCLGIARKTCKECTRLHCACSNKTICMRPNVFIFYFYSMSFQLTRCQTNRTPPMSKVPSPVNVPSPAGPDNPPPSPPPLAPLPSGR